MKMKFHLSKEKENIMLIKKEINYEAEFFETFSISEFNLVYWFIGFTRSVREFPQLKTAEILYCIYRMKRGYIILYLAYHIRTMQPPLNREKCAV